MRKSLPVMNVPSGPMSSAPTPPTSSGVPPRPTGDNSIMRRYPSPRGPVSSSLASGVKIAGADRVDSRAALAPPDSLGHHRSEFPRLGQLVGVQGVGHPVGCEHGQPEQFLGRRRGKGGVLFGGQCAQTVSGL
jgi:hypothetical protein